MKKIILVAALIVLTPATAFAYCSEPSTPYTSLSAPYCSDNVCDSWTASSFEDDVNSDIRKWKTYAEEAIEYARCKQAKAIEEWNDFASTNKVRR